MTWNGEPVDAPHVQADSSGTYVLEATWWGLYSWTQTVEVNIADAPTAEWTIVPPLCHGEAGVLAWASDAAQSVALFGDTLGPSGEGLMLPAGSYPWVWVYGEGCEVQTTVDVVEPSPISFASALDMPACAGETGAVEVAVSGGTEPHVLNWHGADPDALAQHRDLVGRGCQWMSGHAGVGVTEPAVGVQPSSHPVSGTAPGLHWRLQGAPPYDTLWTAGVWDNGWTLLELLMAVEMPMDVFPLELAENPLADLSEVDWPIPVPVREGRLITWNGPTSGLVWVQVFDRLGRALVTASGPGHALDVGTNGPCIIQAEFTDGSVRRWKR